MNRCQHFNNLIMKMGNMARGGNLPSQYQRVEYLQSSGTQFINTGVKASNGLAVQAKVINTENPQGHGINHVFLGARTSATNRFFTWVFDGQGGIYYGYRDVYGSIGKTWRAQTVYEFTSTITDSVFSIECLGEYGWSWSRQITQQFAGDVNLYLYACNDWNSSASNLLKGKVFYCTIEKDGVLIRDFIPCYRRSDLKPGMYDKVTKQFYTNSGTGEFTVGLEI